MAYKVSYKVVSEQGEQLKAVAKDMDNYISVINSVSSRLGNDELLQSVRNDLGKFRQQLEEEKTVLNFAGQVIVDVIKSYTGVEKKSVSKVDKAKAHNRDFYKRPVSVASAGAAATATATVNVSGAGGAAAAGATTVNVGGDTYVNNTTNVINAAAPGTSGAMGNIAGALEGTAAPVSDISSSAMPDLASAVPVSDIGTAAPDMAGMTGNDAIRAGTIAAAVGSLGAAVGSMAGVTLAENKKARKPEDDQKKD